jgi:hypothetical protein
VSAVSSVVESLPIRIDETVLMRGDTRVPVRATH